MRPIGIPSSHRRIGMFTPFDVAFADLVVTDRGCCASPARTIWSRAAGRLRWRRGWTQPRRPASMRRATASASRQPCGRRRRLAWPATIVSLTRFSASAWLSPVRAATTLASIGAVGGARRSPPLRSTGANRRPSSAREPAFASCLRPTARLPGIRCAAAYRRRDRRLGCSTWRPLAAAGARPEAAPAEDVGGRQRRARSRSARSRTPRRAGHARCRGNRSRRCGRRPRSPRSRPAR